MQTVFAGYVVSAGYEGDVSFPVKPRYIPPQDAKNKTIYFISLLNIIHYLPIDTAAENPFLGFFTSVKNRTYKILSVDFIVLG